MNSKNIFFLSTLFLLAACVPEPKQILTDINVDLNNEVVQRIIQHEIDQNRDSLTFYAQSSDPTHRYLVARAFASYQSEQSIKILDSLLNDPIREISAMAAYSLGQLRTPKVESILVSAFKSQDTTSVNSLLNSRILEAIGKTGNKKMLNAQANISTYRKTDTLLLLGQVRGFYNFSLRNMVDEKATETVISYLNDASYPESVRLIGAHYLARSPEVNIEDYKYQISQAFIKETNPEIKMTLAYALRKTIDKDIQTLLLDQLELDQDYRVRINTIKALSTQDYIGGAEKMIGLLDDPNLNVALTAADFFINNGNKDDAVIYRNLAREKKRPYQVRAKLFYAVFKNLPYYYTKTISATRWELMNYIKELEDPYEKSAFISAFSNDPGSYSELIKMLETEESLVCKTAIMQALEGIVGHSEFIQTFQSNQRFVKRQILGTINKVLEGNNSGMIAVAGNILSNQDAGFKDLIDSTTNIENALSELNLPRDIEAYNALEKAVALMKGVRDPVLTTVDSKFKPNFKLLDQFKDDPEVIVKTSSGIFNIHLFIEEAPISCLNFLSLVEDNYFLDKSFHRVVPNFVIQGGCNRGDGYGSLDYSIRSEVGPLYYDQEGYIGYASAGLHTESSQWFVTHSATPHLDGKYTIFGKISAGMDVIHQVMVGDTIQDLIIKQI